VVTSNRTRSYVNRTRPAAREVQALRSAEERLRHVLASATTRPVLTGVPAARRVVHLRIEFGEDIRRRFALTPDIRDDRFNDPAGMECRRLLQSNQPDAGQECLVKLTDVVCCQDPAHMRQVDVCSKRFLVGSSLA
jgi:hypothetical protein